MIRTFNEQVALLESNPRKDASKMLADTHMWDYAGEGIEDPKERKKAIEDECFKVIMKMRDGVHAFAHSAPAFDKYLKGLARLLIKYSHGNVKNVDSFIDHELGVLGQYIEWAKNERDEIQNDKQREKFDAKFLKDMSLDDVKDEVKRLDDEKKANTDSEAEAEPEEEEEVDTSNSNYSIVPITSYDQMHDLYGGTKTGDGYSGGWCHTNGRGTYDNWINHMHNGNNRFFVLQNNDWKNIPFNAESNRNNPKDAYGNSLIAILTNRFGKLENATLRCNHVGVPKEADNQYKTYAELSKVAGFDVEKKIKSMCDKYDANAMFVLDGEDRSILRRLDPEFAGEKKITIPSTVKVIGQRAFANNKDIYSIVIPEGVTTIQSGAFEGCTTLKKIKIPNSVTTIENNAFKSTGLIEVDLPSELEEISTNLFYACDSLAEVKIHGKVHTIMNGAFGLCNYLDTVQFDGSSSLTEIQNNAFLECSKLENISLPSSVVKLGNDVFASCSSLKTIDLPDEIMEMGVNIFKDCVKLERVGLPKNLYEFPKIFSGCTSLKEVELPEGLRTIGSGAMAYMGIETLNIPSSVTSIGDKVFDHCENLKEITIPRSVTSVGSFAFLSCHNLKSVRLDCRMEVIPRGMFYDCGNLEEVNIPDGVTVIEPRAFKSCASLTSIVIPDSVMEIKEQAFGACLKLSEVIMSDTTEYKENSFMTTPYAVERGWTSKEKFDKSVEEWKEQQRKKGVAVESWNVPSKNTKLSLFEDTMKEGIIKIPLNESLGDYTQSDFDTFWWEKIGTDALGRKWFWTADKDTSDGYCFYVIYEVDDGEYNIFNDYWLKSDYDEDEYEDLKYRACVEDAQSSDLWYGEE